MNLSAATAALLTMASIMGSAAAASSAYVTYYDSSDCATGTAVGTRGFVANEPWSFRGADSGGSCAAEMPCYLDETSPECTALPVTLEGSAYVEIDETTGEHTVCVNDQCGIVSKDACSPSAIFASCSFKIMSIDDMEADPTLLENPANEATNTAYGVFFSDDKCTDAVGLTGKVSGMDFQLPLVGYDETTDLTCEEMMACILNPEGETCSTMATGAAELNLETRDGTGFYLCDTSNELQGEEDECSLLPSDVCMVASTVNGCYFRAVTSTYLMENPDAVLNGGMLAAAEDTEEGEEEDIDTTSAATPAAVASFTIASFVLAFFL